MRALNRLNQTSLVGFTPAGNHLLTWEACGIRLWDVRTLHNVSYLSFAELGGELAAANMSADGRLVALVPEAGFFEVAYQETP